MTEFYSSIQDGSMSGNVAYTLPTAAAASDGYGLSCTTARVMSWASISGASSGITTIASGSLSGSSITITSIPATYTSLILDLTSVKTSGSTNVYLYFSTNNGSSYDTTANNYPGIIWQVGGSGVANGLQGLTTNSSTASASYCVIQAYHGGMYPLVRTTLNATGTYQQEIGAYIGSTSAINAVKIAPLSGTFSTGSYALYGVI